MRTRQSLPTLLLNLNLRIIYLLVDSCGRKVKGKREKKLARFGKRERKRERERGNRSSGRRRCREREREVTGPSLLCQLFLDLLTIQAGGDGRCFLTQ